jgi:hypothetical protein
VYTCDFAHESVCNLNFNKLFLKCVDKRLLLVGEGKLKAKTVNPLTTNRAPNRTQNRTRLDVHTYSFQFPHLLSDLCGIQSQNNLLCIPSSCHLFIFSCYLFSEALLTQPVPASVSPLSSRLHLTAAALPGKEDEQQI